MQSPFASLLRADLAELRAYEPDVVPPSFAKLDANEAPELLSHAARDALGRAMCPAAFGRYPDARALDLRRAIATACSAEIDEVLVGVGSDEVIALLVTALDRPAEGARAPIVLTVSPTFAMYRLSARARGWRVVEVPLDDRWDLDVGAMKRAIAFGQPNLIFLASPNNPTGALLSEDRIREVIAAAPRSVVVVDEAYADFAPRSQLHLRTEFPNVVVLRTLSKVGFAALRVGWMLGPAALVAELNKARQPYNLPEPSQRGARFVLEELGSERARIASAIVAERERVADRLRALGCDVPASHANFVWVGTRQPAKDVHEHLLARGILVRSFHAHGGRLAHRVRITIGLQAENDRLLSEVEACSSPV